MLFIIDINKAFDSVPHYDLLVKLWQTGETGNVWKFFDGYLSGRLQCVSVNKCHSDFLPMMSGVPHGSILGTFLFIK